MVLVRSLLILAVVGLLAIGAALPASAERRVALLIGNAAYNQGPLRNPGRDVAAMKRALSSIGFELVSAHTDLGRDAMLAAIEDFSDRVRGAEIGLVFYSGHGLEVGGTNYLVPTDARLAAARDVKYETIPLDEIVSALDGATRLRMILLDACRDNPFAVADGRTKGGGSRGLAVVSAGDGNMLIAYAAAPGAVAYDGDGDLSPFTQALTRNLVIPDLDIRIALGKVRDEVQASTRARQKPFLTMSLGGDAITLASRPSQQGGGVEPAPPPVVVPWRSLVSGLEETTRFRVVNVPAGDVLFLRAGPDRSADAVGAIPFLGEGVVRLDASSVAGWWRVRYGGLTGWANSRNLAAMPSGPPAPAAEIVDEFAYRYQGETSTTVADFSACRAQCRADRTCRGLTYFKARSLCRLMTDTDRPLDANSEAISLRFVGAR
ncbi:caspase family protein [Prosthecodimorpha staleyi]|uniref:Caspase family protein n=1 Tax=Prosthecodimorpha staleyi TaxID=2840188 RepID=A0A947GF69_9HYPH|nr:caspase family protein [Prosthecodimorpha staleyi]MBT9290210.1 caspase family protein [Prosthecodimorpha staleyi]